MAIKLPHPLVLLLGGIVVAAVLTWVLPAGEYERREDPATGRQVVVAGTYHRVEAAPVGPFATAVAVPRGVVAGADVIAVILFVGGAFVIVDRLGTFGLVIGGLLGRFRQRKLWAIPVVTLLFAVMGALENMQEEVIPLVPVLLVLGAGLGVDAIAVVSMSLGGAMIGSAFGPTNPFQAAIALQLAELPLLSAGGLRLVMFFAGVALWSAWTMRYAARNRVEVVAPPPPSGGTSVGKHTLIVLAVLVPFAAYVYGALQWGWGFDELSGALFVGAVLAGLVGGQGVEGTTKTYLEGMQSLLPAALLVGFARSISVVLTDGRVIDTILNGLATPLSHVSGAMAGLLMIPFHAILHVPVSSVSGQAVLTMPVMVPLADLLGFSRQVAVLAYQTGAGLTELVTPTNGALMAVLLAAGVPFNKWIRFVVPGVLLASLIGVVAILYVLAVGL
jgi:uncharacterized ion transporter superfamily protein YfcC